MKTTPQPTEWHNGYAAGYDAAMASRSPLEQDFPCNAKGPDGALCRLTFGHAAHVAEPHCWTDAWAPDETG